MKRDANIIVKGPGTPNGIKASLMSDSKWRKLISALDRPDLILEQAIVKFVDGSEEHIIQMPKRAFLHSPHAYFDSSEFGPILFRTIEWLELPNSATYANRAPDGIGRVPSSNVAQSVDQAERILSMLGRFPLVRTERGLRIQAHVRQP
jgi:hypothetical protein